MPHFQHHQYWHQGEKHITAFTLFPITPVQGRKENVFREIPVAQLAACQWVLHIYLNDPCTLFTLATVLAGSQKHGRLKITICKFTAKGKPNAEKRLQYFWCQNNFQQAEKCKISCAGHDVLFCDPEISPKSTKWMCKCKAQRWL